MSVKVCQASRYSPSQHSICPCLQWFSAIDADRSGQLDPEELQKALVSPWPLPDICTLLNEMLTGHDVLTGTGEPAFQPDCLLTHHTVRLYPTQSTCPVPAVPVISHDVHSMLNSSVAIGRIHDKDSSGTISFNEFKGMHQFLTQAQQDFSQADASRQGRIDKAAVRRMLEQRGAPCSWACMEPYIASVLIPAGNSTGIDACPN